MTVLKEFTIDKLNVRVFEGREAMGVCAGSEAIDCLRTLLQRKDEINVMFAAAPSQNETLAALCAAEGIDWGRVNAFHMDEYVGLDPEHPAGFRNFLRRTVFNMLPLKSVNLIDASAADLQAAVRAYDALLRKYPLDVCILGIGENGHIAFNDPPVADFSDHAMAKVVELDQRCREQQVHDGCFQKLEQVPTHAITVTIPALMSAARLFCIVPSATKAEAVKNMLYGEISTGSPASILRMHPNAALYLDPGAAKYIL